MNDLDGKLITVYMTGGWTFTGLVTFCDDEFLMLETPVSQLMVNRKHISVSETAKLRDENEEPIDEIDNSYTETDIDSDELSSGSFYGSIIPDDLLLPSDEPSDTIDFSMSFGSDSKARTKSYRKEGT